MSTLYERNVWEMLKERAEIAKTAVDFGIIDLPRNIICCDCCEEFTEAEIPEHEICPLCFSHKLVVREEK